MNNLLLTILLSLTLLNPLLTHASPRALSFPFDHGKHSETELEWWRFWGHLEDSNNQLFGFTLDFIRVSAPPQNPPSLWRADSIYTSHFTVTDGEGKQFYSRTKENRSSFNFAGASNTQMLLWNRNWTALIDTDHILLKANSKNAELQLHLKPMKSPLLFGKNGFFENLNLYYYALPNIQGNGILRLGEHNHQIVAIRSSMEHAFQMKKNSDILWDKFVIQLSNGDDIFLYILAAKNNNFVSPESFCIINHADNTSVFLKLSEFEFIQSNSWYSESSKITYPSSWILNIPSEHYHLNIDPVIKEQEVVTIDNTYWQGQSLITGNRDNTPIRGYAYVELSKKVHRQYIL